METSNNIVAQFGHDSRSHEEYFNDLLSKGTVRKEQPTPTPVNLPPKIPHAELDAYVQALLARTNTATFVLQSLDSRLHPHPNAHTAESATLRRITTEMPAPPTGDPQFRPVTPPNA